MKRSWIISIGTELTLGQTVDTNAAWLARRLAEFGVRADRHLTVPDAADAICHALHAGANSADLVIVTGGLGPTVDDLTRQALADAAAVELQLDAVSLERIRAFFAQRGREMPETNRVQALLPRGGRVIPNACGTAPGIFIELNGTPCYALPGVPFEMEAMFNAELAPTLRAAATGRTLRSRVLHSFGLGESDLGERIGDLMTRGKNPEVGTTAQLGVIGVRLNAFADSDEAATALLDETEREVRERLGEVVFGRDGDTLASVVGELLAANGATISTAESCTGGLIAKELTDVPGSSRYFLGGAVTYANSAKEALLGVSGEVIATEGAVSEAVARQMALGAQNTFGSTHAISVTGIAGPGGGSEQKPVGLVYIGLANPIGATARRYRFGRDTPRAVIRERAARTALNLVRLELRRSLGSRD